MKQMQRRAMNAVALALGLMSAPSDVRAQSVSRGASADAKRILVAVFSANEKLAGVAVADAIRGRLTSSANPRQLIITPKENIVSYLTNSGYQPDSSLGLTDVKELAKGLRADEVVMGTVVKTGSSYKIDPRLAMASDPTFQQPLPHVETGNLTDAGRQVEKAVLEARKQIPQFLACQNAIRDGKIPTAIAAANTAIVQYPNATIARLCLANAFGEAKQPDSVLKVLGDIARIDPANGKMNAFAFRAWQTKADAEQDQAKREEYREKSVRALVGLLASDPMNPTLQNQVVQELGKLGKPSVAIPIVEGLLQQNPGDPNFLGVKWRLLSQAAATADSASKVEAIARFLLAGEEMVHADTSLADSAYFQRQISAATGHSPAKAVEWLSRGLAKYPNNQDWWWFRANQEFKGGQLPAAQQSIARLTALNPKYTAGAVTINVFLSQIFVQQKMTDSVIALARRAVAAGEDRRTWGTVLLGPVQAMVANAQALSRDTTKGAETLAQWEAILPIAQEADKLNPQAASKFFIGFSSFNIGVDALQKAQPLGNAQPKNEKPAAKTARLKEACTYATKAQDMFVLTQFNMPAGGSLVPDVAKQVLGAVAQYAPGADEMVKRWCK